MSQQAGGVESTAGIKLLLTVDEAAALLNLGRSSVYKLVWGNELHSITIGRTRRIVTASVHAYLARKLAFQ